MPVFPVHIPVVRSIDGPAFEKRLREKGLDDAQIRAVHDALKEEGLIMEETDKGTRIRLVVIGFAVALLLTMLGAAIAMQSGH